jgi:hypothetical protein
MVRGPIAALPSHSHFVAVADTQEEEEWYRLRLPPRRLELWVVRSNLAVFKKVFKKK